MSIAKAFECRAFIFSTVTNPIQYPNLTHSIEEGLVDGQRESFFTAFDKAFLFVVIAMTLSITFRLATLRYVKNKLSDFFCNSFLVIQRKR